MIKEVDGMRSETGGRTGSLCGSSRGHVNEKGNGPHEKGSIGPKRE